MYTAKNLGEEFIMALSELESASDVEQMVALFDDDCVVENTGAPDNYRGIEGACRFWTGSRDSFKEVCSIYRKELYTDNRARLEWTTEGKSKSGQKIKYEAVSLLETRGEKITRFYANFNTKLAIKLNESGTRPENKQQFDTQ